MAGDLRQFFKSLIKAKNYFIENFLPKFIL